MKRKRKKTQRDDRERERERERERSFATFPGALVQKGKHLKKLSTVSSTSTVC